MNLSCLITFLFSESKSQSYFNLNEDKSEGSNQNKFLKIILPHGQIHSALIRANRTLKDIIEKLCDTRPNLSLDKFYVRDKNGNDLDLSVQLTDLKHTEIEFCQPKGNYHSQHFKQNLSKFSVFCLSCCFKFTFFQT
jgi:hypothetical protein